MSSTVKDVMITHVIAVRPCAPYKEMAALLRDQRVKRLPVASRAGHDIIAAVRQLEGVVFVRDRLSYPNDSPYLRRVAR